MIKTLLFSCIAGCLLIPAKAQYCTPTYTTGTTDNDYINGVSLAEINNLENGAGDGSGYSDFTDMNANLVAGETYDLFIDNTPSFTEYYRIWIDYDRDEVFESSEEITTSFLLTAGASTTISFTVPTAVALGTTRMRVRCVYGALTFDACSNYTYGEAEDYSITLSGIEDDLSVTAISPIAESCELSADEPISITVANLGVNPATGFSVSFSVDGGPATTEPFPGGILAGESEVYTFAGGADLSADGAHVITAWVNYATDDYLLNDSTDISVINAYTYLTTGFPENVCYAGGTIFPSPVAGGGTWTGDGIIDATTGEMDPSLLGGIGGSATVTYDFIPTADYTVSEIPYEPVIPIDPTELALGDDATAPGISIGFPFKYFDNTYTTLFISSNGLVGFGAPSNSYNAQNFPNAADPDEIIAWCWTDLNPGAGGTISYETIGTAPNRKFVVYYDEVTHYASEMTVTGQLVLYESSNAIDMIAIDIQSDGGVMTQGIENINGTDAYYADEAYNLEVWSMDMTTWRYARTPCAGTVTETIHFIEPPVVELISDSVCIGTTVTLDAGEGAEYYVWSTGESTQTIDVVESGTYSVTYYANATCYVSDSATVVVSPLPAIHLGPDGVACEGTMLDAENPGSEYTWNTGATTQTLFVSESGTYSVTVDNPVTGCSNADTISMTIIPLPDAAFEALPTGALTIVFTSLSTDAVTWFWDFGDGTTSTVENPWHTYPYAGDYTVTLVVTNDCGADITSDVLQATTAVADLQKNNLLIYPNPTSDNITIQTTLNGAATYKIIHAGGAVVATGNVESNTISVSNLAAGMYQLQLMQGTALYSTVFIKQ